MADWRKLEHHGRQMRLEMRMKADPQRVWEAWADPGKISQWFTDRASGEAKPGGTVTWIFEKFGYVIPYEVKDAVPGERFAIGGQLPGRPPFLLEVTLKRDGGETVVTIVNSGFLEGAQWEDEYEGIFSGWSLSLILLKQYVERHFGEPKNTLLVMRPAEFAFDRVLPFYTSAEGLKAWLASSAEVGSSGEPYRMELRDGTRASGHVLWATRREVALSWSEIDAVLELKAFTMGPEKKMIGVRLTAWGPDGGRVQGLEPGLSAALDRLAAKLAA